MRDLTSMSLRGRSTAPSARSCTCRPGPTAAARSNASPGRCGRTDGSPGTPSPSTTRSRRAWTAEHQDGPVPRTNRYAVGDNRIDITLGRRREELPLVGDDDRVARAHRRRRLSGGGPYRRLRRRAVRKRQPGVRLRRPPLRRTLSDKPSRSADNVPRRPRLLARRQRPGDVLIKEVMPDKSFTGRRTSLRAGSASQVFARSGTAPEDEGAGHRPGGDRKAEHAFKTGVGARAPRRVRFPSASAAERGL